MKSKFGRILLRYLIFVGIPYLVACRLEKFIFSRLDIETKKQLRKRNKRLFPELEKYDNVIEISKEAEEILENTPRGGAGPVISSFLLWLLGNVSDLGIKSAIISAIGTAIAGELADGYLSTMLKFGTSIVHSPGTKFLTARNKIEELDLFQSEAETEIQKLLLSNNMTTKDKIHYVSVKVQEILKKLHGPKRKQFILFVLALLFFFFGGNSITTHPSLTVLMESLRKMLGSDSELDMRDALIDTYLEFNAPLPEDLVNSINNIS